MFALDILNQFQDYNGTVLSAGKLYVYYLGRTSLAEIYSDVNGQIPIANPVILDNLGMSEIYLSNEHYYTVVVCDPWDNELFSRDIYPGEGGTGPGYRLYEGIAPIVVNNEKLAISAKCATFGVQSPLCFVEDSESATIIGFDGEVPSVTGVMYVSALSGEDGVITSYSGSAFSTNDNFDVKAGANINVATAGDEFTVSGKDWTTEIQDASANALSEAVNNITAVQSALSADSATISNSALTANYALSADSATYDNLGREITATYLTACTGDTTEYSAGSNIYILNHVISGKDWTDDITAASANALSEAINNITAVDSALSANYVVNGWEYSDNKITGYSGSAFGQFDVQAGDNISVTTADGTYTVSGKDWSDDITAASANAYNEAVNNITAVNSALSATYDSDGNKITETYLSAITVQDVPELPYVENSALSTTEGGLFSAISGTGFYASNVVEYSAGSNIDITNHIVSGKDWTDTITAASSNAYNEAINNITAVDSSTSASIANSALTALYVASGWEYEDGHITGYSGSSFSAGKVYEGIEPIVVNNEENKISARSAHLGVVEPLYFVEDSTTATTIGLHETALAAKYLTAGWEYDNSGNISAYSGSAFVGSDRCPQVQVSGVNGISITKPNDVVLIGFTGDVGTNYVAGDNINITNNVISGKNWQNTITAASAYAYNAATAIIPQTGHYIPYTAFTANEYFTNSALTVSSNSGYVQIIPKHTNYQDEAHVRVVTNYDNGTSWLAEVDGADSGHIHQIWQTGENTYPGYMMDWVRDGFFYDYFTAYNDFEVLASWTTGDWNNAKALYSHVNSASAGWSTLTYTTGTI